MESKQRIIVITGPTAAGKTLFGIHLAKQIDGEVVSADSMQVYKYMDIGTAKPSLSEMDGITHHMIDVAEPWEDYSVARFVREAIPCIDDILSRNKQPIVVGGSGLYIDSLVRGRAFASRVDPALRQTLEKRYDTLGGGAMLEQLRQLDAISADRLHENDKKRIVRAFEVIESTGKPLSVHDAEEKASPARYDAIKIALTYENRDVLYEKIRQRIDNMLRAGFVDEVSSLLSRGIPQSCTSMQAIGYKQLAEAIAANAPADTAVGKIKMESTRYAKRQLTWLRRDKDISWLLWKNAPDIKGGIDRIGELLHETK